MWSAHEIEIRLEARDVGPVGTLQRTGSAWNAIAEQLDYGRRYTARTNQVQRSFEDVSPKQRALDLVIAA